MVLLLKNIMDTLGDTLAQVKKICADLQAAGAGLAAGAADRAAQRRDVRQRKRRQRGVLQCGAGWLGGPPPSPSDECVDVGIRR